MKVFYGIEEGFLVNGNDLADDKLMTFETPLEEKYIKNIDFNDDFADEVQRVFTDVNRENFFDLAVDPNSVIAKYSDSTDILTLDYDNPVLTAFLTETFHSCVKNFVVESHKIQVFIVQGDVTLWFYVEGYSTNEPTQGGEVGYTFPIELNQDETALLYKLVW